MTPEAFNTALGKAVRKHRMLRGWSMKFIADKMGYTYQQQQKYELATNGLSTFYVWQLAELFGLPVEELYREAGIQAKATAEPSPSDNDAILAARYVGKIPSGKLRRNIIDFARKCAYEENAA